MAPAAIEQVGRNQRGERLDTGPFSQRPLNAKSGDSIGKSAGLSTRVRQPRQIARKPKRSTMAVTVKADWLKVSIRIREGYKISDLAEVFGVHHHRVETWARRGLLGKAHRLGGDQGDIRFTEANVVRFIREHPREYHLGRVHRVWFKAMIFGYPAECGGEDLRRENAV